MQQAEDVSGDESDWESASDDEEAAAEAAAAAAAAAGQPDASDMSTQSGAAADADDAKDMDASSWEEWDLRRSLFDNHMSPSFEANLDYMFKNFGFYFPDAEYLKDPEGLLKYLVRLSAFQRFFFCRTRAWTPTRTTFLRSSGYTSRMSSTCRTRRACSSTWSAL